MDILFTNATILPMTAAGDEPKTFMGAVGVAGNRIALVTESGSEADAFRTCNPGGRVIDCTGRLLMPGLVNTHCHAAMTLQRSYADDIALMEWLNDYIWPFEARQTADDVALGMTLGIVEMLLGGVTSFVDMYYHENRCVEVAERLGIRAMLGCNYFDSNVEEVLPEVGQAVELAAGCDRIRIALAPHSPYTVSPENLRRGKETAERYGLHLMTHIAETQDEVRIVREKYGMTPVYLPNLMDGSTRVLDKPLMNRIIREAMPDLPDNTKRVIVYYIDIDNREEIERFIREQGNPLVTIELRDLKQVLDNVVVEDLAEWEVSEESNGLFNGWKVEIKQFQSDRVRQKIYEINQKNQLQVLQQKAKGKEKTFTPILVSDEGLETIEWISLDCTTAERSAPWHSDSEIKIDKLGCVIKNGTKTTDYWDACIRCDHKPLRMKIRNICGDETVILL